MGLIDLAKDDAKEITSDLDGFAVEITVTDKDGRTEVVNGTSARHNMDFDEAGVASSGAQAHCTIHEGILSDAGFTVRDSENLVSVKGWLVSFRNSAGQMIDYIVMEQIADETVGLIPMILGEYTPDE